MALDEFEIVRRWFRDGPAAAGVTLGIGDDAALLRPPPGQELAVSTDALLEGRHFPATLRPGEIGYRCLAVNLSDLAAMGAQPRWFLLSLSLPRAEADWLDSFAAGLFEVAREFGVGLVGGDLSRAPLGVCVTVLGTVPRGRAMRRTGARPGDWVCVTGTLGDAARALRLETCPGETERGRAALHERLARPRPRVHEALLLRDKASSCIDISDGLAADLRHLLEASGVGAFLNAEQLPLSPALRASCPRTEALQLAAGGGDDYELCFTLPPARWTTLDPELRRACTRIGEVEAAPGLRWRDSGRTFQPRAEGFRHFTSRGAPPPGDS